MTLELYHRVSGDGPPLILLHGLFGSLDNLNGVAHRLSSHFQIHALDLRNHGRSPHAGSMSYPDMANDVLAYMSRHGLERASLLGHSMGGKTAMQVALNAPDRVDKLIVADIAPVSYPPHHDEILAGLAAVDPASLHSRTEGDRILADYVPEVAVRQFLLKNLVRREGGGFAWRMNLPVIRRCYQQVTAGQQGSGPFEGPVLFIKGGNSNYIQARYRDQVARLFPRAEIRIIPGTGHWLHAEKPEVFAALCERFLLADEKKAAPETGDPVDGGYNE